MGRVGGRGGRHRGVGQVAEGGQVGRADPGGRAWCVVGAGNGCLAEHVVAKGLQAGEWWRLPPAEGGIDVNVYLLWNRDQKRTHAEAVFLERFEQALLATDVRNRF